MIINDKPKRTEVGNVGKIGVETDAFALGCYPSSALWDTVVNFDAGDTVTIWGPDFNFKFANPHCAMGYAGLTLLATAANSLKVSVTRAGRCIDALNEGVPVEMFYTGPSHGKSSCTHSYGLREPDTQYVTVAKAATRVIVPHGTTLTPRVLLGALLKMPTLDIENTIEDLIAELNIRCRDPDDEPEPEERIG